MIFPEVKKCMVEMERVFINNNYLSMILPNVVDEIVRLKLNFFLPFPS